MTLDGGAERALTNSPGGRASGDIFICFAATTSSSASMRSFSNKSLPSPGRKEGKFRDPVATAGAPALSVSLSRGLRSSGSVKGGQSPGLFATGGSRKKASSFEAAEPTSPKVTCIGQVRVKTGRRKKKKKAAALRSRSRRDVSFRRPDQRGDGLAEKECFPNRGQSWVHLPLGNICEAVKAFGSEINCFTPCGGGGSGRAAAGGSGEAVREKVGCGGGKRAKMGTCGSAFARWLMAIEEDEEEQGKRGEEVEMGIVVEEVVGRRGSRRELREFEMVADELEKRELAAVEKSGRVEEEAAAEEVPLCVPPRNALLLMRCRSDPVKMSALATRFWGSPVAAKVSVEEEVIGGGNGRMEDMEEEEEEEPSKIKYGKANSADAVEKAGNPPSAAIEENPSETGAKEEDMEEKDGLFQKEEATEQNLSRGSVVIEAPAGPILEEEQGEEALDETSTLVEVVGENQVADECHSHDNEEEKENRVVQEDQKGREKKKSRRSSPVAKDGEQKRWSFSKEREAGRRHSFSTDKDVRRSSSCREGRRSSFSSEGQARRSSFSTVREARCRRSFSTEKEARRATGPETAVPIKALVEEKLSELLSRETESATAPAAVGPQPVVATEVRRTRKEEEKKEGLPDCLLLMMYEPKLSMEVSKETWVCTADFIRRKPHQRRLQNKQAADDGGQEEAAPDVAAVESVKKPDAAAAGPPLSPPVSAAATWGEHTLSPPVSAPEAAAEPAEVKKTAEQKLGSATAAVTVAAYGPFVLTRCKSEPMRSSAKLSPEMCFWKSRHQPIGAAGLGF